mmetsp:Transcript_26610/g.66865  ORF Transcript_26610/g.66865 Transcript_26610/m.66865 type:complete len:1029 (-) Transcript_26610:237-3323(-)
MSSSGANAKEDTPTGASNNPDAEDGGGSVSPRSPTSSRPRLQKTTRKKDFEGDLKDMGVERIKTKPSLELSVEGSSASKSTRRHTVSGDGKDKVSKKGKDSLKPMAKEKKEKRRSGRMKPLNMLGGGKKKKKPEFSIGGPTGFKHVSHNTVDEPGAAAVQAQIVAATTEDETAAANSAAFTAPPPPPPSSSLDVPQASSTTTDLSDVSGYSSDEDATDPSTFRGLSSSSGGDAFASLGLAIALWDYEASGDGELSVSEHEILDILKQLSEEHWELRSHLSGKQGSVPTKYVAALPEKASAARAIWNFSADGEAELDVAEGEVVEIIEESDEQWVHVRSLQSGHEGAVPRDYLERINVNAAKEESEKRRNHIAMEIGSTEASYVKSLENMLANFRKPLVSLSTDDGPIKSSDVTKIFSNAEQLYQLNSEILTKIQERLENWSAETLLGDIFVQLAPVMIIYTEYGNNYEEALQCLVNNLKNAKFQEIHEQGKKLSQNFSLEHLLIMPIQRIPRYNLLLADLLKHTDKAHPDYQNLKTALATTQTLGDRFNQSMRDASNSKRLLAASQDGGLGGFLAPHRHMIKDGSYITMKAGVGVRCESALSGGKKVHERLHFFLFNDMFAFALEKEVKRHKDVSKVALKFPLNLIWMRETGKGLTKLEFEIIAPNVSLTLTLDSVQAKNEWVDLLRKTVDSHLAASCPPLTIDSAERQGAFTFPDGGVYSGCWISGTMQGHGIYTNLGNKYVGAFVDGSMCGEGEVRYFNGDSYSGEWAEGYPHGKGVWTSSLKDTYEGNFVMGVKHGQGKMTFADGTAYRGEWVKDKPDGQGELRLSSGIGYTGGFKQNLFHGKGVLSSSTGKQYDGAFVNGIRTGKGTMKYADGSTYVGDWKFDKFNGHGVFEDKTTAVRYEGQFVDGKKDGKGTIVYADSSKYVGHWKENQRSGKGEMSFRNGEKYSGHWKNDEFHGSGRLDMPNGVKLEGNWERGLKEGRFTVTFLYERKRLQATYNKDVCQNGGWLSFDNPPQAFSFNLAEF